MRRDELGTVFWWFLIIIVSTGLMFGAVVFVTNAIEQR
jgi:hypothetical protein